MAAIATNCSFRINSYVRSTWPRKGPLPLAYRFGSDLPLVLRCSGNCLLVAGYVEAVVARVSRFRVHRPLMASSSMAGTTKRCRVFGF